MQPQYVQLLVAVLLVGASGIGWILRKLGEQAQQRAMEQEAERQRLEAFRTGRDSASVRATGQPIAMPLEAPPARAPAPGSPMDIAERRRRQLEELRRRQMARQQGGAAGSAGGGAGGRSGGGVGGPGVLIGIPSAGSPRPPALPRMPSSIPGSSGPTVPMPMRSPPRPGQPRPAPQRTGDQASAEAARREATRRQQERARRAAQEQARAASEQARLRQQRMVEEGESNTKRLVREVDTIEAPRAAAQASAPAGLHDRPARRAVILGREMTPQDVRRAFVMNEVLGPPLALRELE